MKMELSQAEAELIDALRSGEPGAVMVMLKEKGGEWMASTSTPPFDKVEVGVGKSFEEAWRGRVDPATLRVA